jgi:outer membrane lipoprotein-sorting protein
MNRECKRTRGDIERSSIEPLARNRQDEIDAHVERCAACREYLEAMRGDERSLGDFVRSLEPSVERIASESIHAAARGVAAEPVARARARRGITTSRIAVFAAAAALIAVLWGLNHFTGVFGGKPAFADVMAKINTAENVTFRQIMRIEGGEPLTTENMATDTGVLRWTLGGNVNIMDFNKGIDLTMSPSEKRATLVRRVGRPPRKGLFNYVSFISTLHNGPSGKFVDREKIDGFDANVFAVKDGDFLSIRIWADPKTNLPLRVIWTMKHNPELDVTVPRISVYERDFGGDVRVSCILTKSGTGGIAQSTEMTFENFKWNEKLDPDLFSVTPPPGYTVNEQELDDSYEGEKDLVDALSFWASMSRKSFPEQIADLCAEEKVRLKLIEAYDKQGDPHEEYQEALTAAGLLLDGLYFSQDMKGNGDWHYAGAGVKLGEKDKPVCWWKPEGSQKYRILYGDLRVEDIDEAELPKERR